MAATVCGTLCYNPGVKTNASGRRSRTRNISIQPELDDYVLSMVKSGLFANYSEAIRHAVRELKRVHDQRMERLLQNPEFVESLRQAIPDRSDN